MKEGTHPVVVEAAEEGGEGGSDGALNRKVHCKSRGQPCLMAKMKKSWQEAALPLKSSDYKIIKPVLFPREQSCVTCPLVWRGNFERKTVEESGT